MKVSWSVSLAQSEKLAESFGITIGIGDRLSDQEPGPLADRAARVVGMVLDAVVPEDESIIASLNNVQHFPEIGRHSPENFVG